MTWDGTPWFLGGGAQHSPEVARLLAYASTSGAEGIVTPGDLKVVPLAVPGSSVRVLAGACLILNRNASGAQQTYIARNPTEDTKGIAATGSGAGRNDLIVAQIKDPFLPGEPWADPADVTVGPYIFTEVIPNVPLSATTSPEAAADYLRTQGVSALALAAAVLPANTATITTAEIRDLRKLALPRSKREVLMSGPTPEVAMNNEGGAIWPDFRPIVRVPEWATHAYVIATLSSIGHRGGNALGLLTAVLQSTTTGTQYRAANITYDLDASSDAGQRHTLIVGGGFDDVRPVGGRDVYVQLEARKTFASTNPGYLVTVDGTQVLFDVQFYERAV